MLPSAGPRRAPEELLDGEISSTLLGRDIYGRTAALSAGQLNEATQHVLNMLVFCRILEVRDIEPTGRLRECRQRRSALRALGAKTERKAGLPAAQLSAAKERIKMYWHRMPAPREGSIR